MTKQQAAECEEAKRNRTTKFLRFSSKKCKIWTFVAENRNFFFQGILQKQHENQIKMERHDMNRNAYLAFKKEYQSESIFTSQNAFQTSFFFKFP